MRRTTILATALTALTALAAGSAVTAQARDGMGGMMMGGGGPMPGHGMFADFATLDADGDGLVTPAEVDAQLAGRFVAADTNGDGGLDAVEMLAAIEALRAERMAAMAAAQLERMDDSGDGLLQSTEIADRLPSTAMLFDRLDEDGDGAISAAEFEAMQARMAERMGDRRGHGRHGGEGGGFWGWWGGDRQGEE